VIEVRAAVAEDLPAVHRLVRAAYAEFEPRLTPVNWARMTSNIAKVIEPGAPGRLRVAQLGDRLASTVTYLPPAAAWTLRRRPERDRPEVVPG
jgi:hypothetical protein